MGADTFAYVGFLGKDALPSEDGSPPVYTEPPVRIR